MNFVCVALGGAVGALGRYALSLLPVKVSFPVLTLATNLLGAVLIGVLVGILADHPDTDPKWRLFLVTGVCGGFTTFSTFSLETLTLLDEGRWAAAGAYAGLSVVLCVAGVWAGRKLAGW